MAKEKKMISLGFLAIVVIGLLALYGAKTGEDLQPLAVTGTADGSKIIIDLLNSPICMNEGEQRNIAVAFINPTSQPITFNAELGIYRRDYLESYGFLSIAGIDQKPCGYTLLNPESFVASKKITISPDSREWINFTVKAPTSKSTFSPNTGDKWASQPNWLNYGNNYEMLIGTYEACGKGYWKFDRNHLEIQKDCSGAVPPSPSSCASVDDCAVIAGATAYCTNGQCVYVANPPPVPPTFWDKFVEWVTVNAQWVFLGAGLIIFLTGGMYLATRRL